ncbi:type II toxin-antitoxin system VapB family antitoxin [Streptomyces sp. NPDC056708]|uniref:type II toxin-antitoxin system VapB family antitoxin n=1 Tax=unclassified Streptomyces TaxID=2593676 RepID=UPI003698F078
MSVSQIDLDDEALAEAMRLMGATTKKETVNAALRGERGEFEKAAAAYDAVKRAAGGV